MGIIDTISDIIIQNICGLFERELLPLLEIGYLSFIDSHCGKFECDVSTVDTINFRSDFHGTI